MTRLPASAGAPPSASVDPSAPVTTPAVVPTPAASTGPDLPSDGNRLGSADAKVVIDYWADYQCPFCAKFAQETIPLLTPLIADGTVALVHRDYAFIGPESSDAAIAVRCAGREGSYWPMHDAVYAAQDGENEGAFARDRLAAIGASVGLDGSTLEACFADRSLLAEVLADTAAGVRSGIESTPTADVNGKRFLGVPKFDDVKAAIDAAARRRHPRAAARPSDRSTIPGRVPRTEGRTAGDPAAPVTVALWMDYQSTNGATVANALGGELRTRVADGKARLELHDLALLGEESVTAGVALRCIDAQDGPAWLIHDILSVSAPGQGRRDLHRGEPPSTRVAAGPGRRRRSMPAWRIPPSPRRSGTRRQRARRGLGRGTSDRGLRRGQGDGPVRRHARRGQGPRGHRRREMIRSW